MRLTGIQWRNLAAVVLAAAFIGSAALWLNREDASTFESTMPRIAHAGGAFANRTYTNSLDALRANADDYQLFEIDFSFTSDGELVCIHDWEASAVAAFGTRLASRPTLREFEALLANAEEFKNCTLETLAEWMVMHPTKRLVTDVKEDNLRALTLISQRIDNYGRSVIPQIYEPAEYERVRALGYEDIIWTLYRYRGNAEDIVDRASQMRLYAITMPKGHAEGGLARLIRRKLGMPTYVHTINTDAELHHFMELGVSGIYTDYLPDGDK